MQQEAMPAPAKEVHGAFYWFSHKIGGRIKAFARRHWVLFTVIFVGSILALLMLRAAVHPYVIAVRTRIFLTIPIMVLLIYLRRLVFRGPILKRLIWTGVAVPVVYLSAIWGDEVHNYISLYWRYVSVPKTELKEMPTTGYERIQPLNSIYSLAHEAMGETEKPQIPDLVRIGSSYKWTLGVEAAYGLPRFLYGVRAVLAVSATAPAPDFNREKPIKTGFPTGENLLFGRNSYTATIRTFSPWRYLNYEPADVTYTTNDEGEWVQIVQLIRWRGVIFPRPEFGGVQVIPQEPETMSSDFRLMLVGIGEWISPEDIQKYPFLRGQNLVPYRVSRYMADSFRFQAGFFGPMPGNHEGDVRISDMEADVNPQPFTTHFNVPDHEALYQYFGLEPLDPDKQGLNTSVLVPADGSLPIYFYKHFDRGEILLGVSAVSPKVIESKKMYDWNRNRPVEHRPVVKDIEGKRRFFWLTTVITMKEQRTGDRHFIAGAEPEIALTDAAHNYVVWVDARTPDKWVSTVKEKLASKWVQD